MISAHQQRSRRRLYLSLALMSLAALLFFVMQNQSLLVGGEIAPAKLLWLFAAIFYWFVLPLLIVIDGRGSAAMRRIYAIFLANMCARALIELYMMYLSQNWHPYYGIGHDAFSILLILLLAAGTGPWRGIDRVLGRNLWSSDKIEQPDNGVLPISVSVIEHLTIRKNLQ